MNTAGIDFGTTTTLVACWIEEDRRAEFVHLGRSGPELPTTVHVDEERQLIFGDDADDRLSLDPGGYQRRIKLGLGTDRKFLLSGHEFTAVDLCAKFLEHVRHRVETEHLHGKLDRVVIAVPAKFGPAARHDLETAARQAGFGEVELLDEPIAAGIAFLEEKKGSELGNEILVFDWGGGTLDIALVERCGDEWILNHDHLEGDLSLGGEDIDDSLMEVVNSRLVQSGQSSVKDPCDRDYPQVYRRVVETKKLLSKKESHSFTHATENCQFSFSCSREDFEDFISEQTTRAMQCVARWRERSGEKGQSIRNVLLVGGTSQIPVVARHLEKFGMHPLLWTHAMRAVAMGAALRAHQGPSLIERARRGDSSAMFTLAKSCMNGDGMEKDLARAFEWFRRASNAGHANGMNWAGHFLKNGIGTERNLPLALDQFRKSANSGNADGMVRLGVCLMEGAEGDAGKVEGSRWIQKSAELHCPEGMYRFGQWKLQCGEIETGTGWIKGAAEAGHETARREITRLPVIKEPVSSSSTAANQPVQKSNPALAKNDFPEQRMVPSTGLPKDAKVVIVIVGSVFFLCIGYLVLSQFLPGGIAIFLPLAALRAMASSIGKFLD